MYGPFLRVLLMFMHVVSLVLVIGVSGAQKQSLMPKIIDVNSIVVTD